MLAANGIDVAGRSRSSRSGQHRTGDRMDRRDPGVSFSEVEKALGGRRPETLSIGDARPLILAR
jgi:hypothetical protein